MGVSIAIATYNRAQELERTLLSLAEIDQTGVEDFEVLIINNNSTDQTEAVAANLAPRFSGRLRHILEPNQGLSHARNRAVAESRFPVVAFVDDDVDFETDWLRRLWTVCADGAYAAVGGRASLAYPGPRPPWLGERDECFLTRVELGPLPRPAAFNEIYGLNLAIRKDWIVQVGGFRTDLGRIGSCLLSGEETDLLARIAAAGGRLYYEPTARVHHRVPVGRLRRRWFWSRCYWGERGETLMRADEEITPVEVARRCWYVLLECNDLRRTALAHGPRSEECFHSTQLLASRIGASVGLLIRMAAKPFTRSRPCPTHSESRGASAPDLLVASPGSLKTP